MINSDWKQPKYGDFIGFIPIRPVNLLFLPVPYTIYHLIEIKQKAIDELAPLIDKLDLKPEEKFRTIMMMIQATDDESLVELAYEAAHSIEDEKARAQALLDIVNEINYFTQPDSSQAS